MRKQWFIFGAIICLFVMTIIQSTFSKKEQLPRVGYAAPKFSSLKGLDGNSYSLETSRRKPLVINFWASWCDPCRVEAPELVKVYEKYKNQIQIYAVNVTGKDKIADARAFSDKYGYTFPVLLDEKGEVTDLYKIYTIPTTFFIEKNGNIMDMTRGTFDEKTLDNKIKLLLR